MGESREGGPSVRRAAPLPVSFEPTTEVISTAVRNPTWTRSIPAAGRDRAHSGSSPC